MQLTNILRDLKSDAEQDRIYIPQEDLIKFNYSEKDLKQCIYNNSFIDLMKFETDRAEYYYQKADENFSNDDSKVLAMGRAMEEIYFKILMKIKKNNYDVFHKKINLSKMERIFIAMKNYLKY